MFTQGTGAVILISAGKRVAVCPGDASNALLIQLNKSGDTTPCKMTGVTLQSHVRYTE